ncbi:hypothetical protein [Promicromonospora sp. NPDC023987]|uniref:hypothetical protein n=1 Tax=Promicromonospora sp. NPDC023987 TaxID=3155360 RepID=UPI0033F2DC95
MPTAARSRSSCELDRDPGAYALEQERSETSLTIHYAKVDGSVRRLQDLVEVERTCCAFVDWTIDKTHPDLRLIVSGTPLQLAALNIGMVQ